MLSKKQLTMTNIFLLKSKDINGKKFLKYILKEYYGIENYNYYYDKYGKPYIDNYLYFNYSNTSSYVVLAISLNEVGIDIELSSRIFPSNLINYILNSDEKYINSNYYLLKKWVEKESYLKYLGTGINMELSNLKIKKGINKLFYNDRNILLNCFSKNKINHNILFFTLDSNNCYIYNKTIVTSIKDEKDYMR